jgi:hypothetical protein
MSTDHQWGANVLLRDSLDELQSTGFDGANGGWPALVAQRTSAFLTRSSSRNVFAVTPSTAPRPPKIEPVTFMDRCLAIVSRVTVGSGT